MTLWTGVVATHACAGELFTPAVVCTHSGRQVTFSSVSMETEQFHNLHFLCCHVNENSKRKCWVFTCFVIPKLTSECVCVCYYWVSMFALMHSAFTQAGISSSNPQAWINEVVSKTISAKKETFSGCWDMNACPARDSCCLYSGASLSQLDWNMSVLFNNELTEPCISDYDSEKLSRVVHFLTSTNCPIVYIGVILIHHILLWYVKMFMNNCDSAVSCIYKISTLISFHV